jgi:hypothetical protein
MSLNSGLLEGLHVFPCREDKRPLTKHGFYDATSDPVQIMKWRRQFPDALWGIPTGALNGFDCLDIDTKAKGEAWLSEFEATRGFPLTRCHQTRSGGMHFLFRHRPGLQQSYGLIHSGVDVRCDDKGYIIWWPAAGYRVLCEGPIAQWPGALIEALHEAEEAKRSALSSSFYGPNFFNASSAATSGGWMIPNHLWTRLKAATPGASDHDRYRMRGLLRTVVQKRPGERRNQALNDMALAFRPYIEKGVVERAVVERLLYECAVMNGHVAKRGRKQTEDTIGSGLGTSKKKLGP